MRGSFRTFTPVPQHNNQKTVIKRNVCDRNVAQFTWYLVNETWSIVYGEGAQKVFIWSQGVINLFFDKCFQKEIKYYSNEVDIHKTYVKHHKNDVKQI